MQQFSFLLFNYAPTCGIFNVVFLVQVSAYLHFVTVFKCLAVNVWRSNKSNILVEVNDNIQA